MSKLTFFELFPDSAYSVGITHINGCKAFAVSYISVLNEGILGEDEDVCSLSLLPVQNMNPNLQVVKDLLDLLSCTISELPERLLSVTGQGLEASSVDHYIDPAFFEGEVTTEQSSLMDFSDSSEESFSFPTATRH